MQCNSWSATIIDSLKQEVTAKRRYELKHRNECALVHEHDEIEGGKPASGKDWLWGSNSNYAFTLYRETQDKPWAILETTNDLSEKLPYLSMFPTPGQLVDFILDLPVTCGTINKDLKPFLTDYSELSINQVSPVIKDGRTLVRVDFDLLPQDPKMILRGGWFLYDPEHFWVIRAYEVQVEFLRSAGTSSKGTIKATYDYQDDSAELPLLKKTLKNIKVFDVPPSELEYVQEYDIRELELPEKDFTLSAFGLPEPLNSPKPRPRWYWWTALAGGVLIVASIGTGLWLRRRRAVA